jgi:hypothetical protein
MKEKVIHMVTVPKLMAYNLYYTVCNKCVQQHSITTKNDTTTCKNCLRIMGKLK